MRSVITLGLTALVLLAARVRADEPKKDDKAEAAKLVGVYEIVGGEKDGQKIEAGRLKEVTVRIAANAITTFDKDKKEVYVATYELDTSRKPCRITLTATVTPKGGKGTTAEGLIERDGDTVKLIYALPGGKAPTELRAGDKQQMFILRKSGK